MSSVQSLREFISERLTAAAEEIFTEVEKTIVRYEEEIDRQRRLLDLSWKPRIILHRTELPQHIWKEETILTEQQLCNQERNTSLDQEEPEPPHIKEDQEKPELQEMKEDHEEPESPKIKEEQEEPECSQMMKYFEDPNFPHNRGKQEAPEPPKEEPEFLEIKAKQEAETFMVTPAFNELNHWELELNTWDQFLSQNSPKVENQDQEISRNVDPGPCSDEEPKQNQRNLQTGGYGENVDRPNIKVDQKKPFLCLSLGKKFNVKHNLTVHMRNRTGWKPHFSCETCGKGFNKNFDLFRHMRTHRSEKSFSCETCGKGFNQNFDLFRHMRTHTNEKPFSCQTCGKCFRCRSGLVCHTRIHTGEKLYSCQTCGKRFCYRGVMIYHMKTHTT